VLFAAVPPGFSLRTYRSEPVFSSRLKFCLTRECVPPPNSLWNWLGLISRMKSSVTIIGRNSTA